MRKLFGLHVLWIPIAVSVWLSNGPVAGWASQPTQSLLGMNLSTAQNTDFFTFFHLVESGREQDSTRRSVVIFKPSSEAFRKIVTVRTTLSSRNEIVQMELDLARSFIDSSDEGRFANDIAKTMLGESPPPQDLPEILDLARQIYRPTSSTMESPGYLTYIGRRQVYTQNLSACVLYMENVKQNGENWLQIRLSLTS